MATYRKRGDKWEYRISYKDPVTEKYKIKSKSGFTTKKEAQIAAQKMENEILEGVEQSPISLKNFLNTWLYEFKKDTIRKNTFNLHKQNIEKHILPYFKEIKLANVKPILYQKFLNQLIDQGYSKRTVEIVHSTMFNAFEKAVILGKVTKNPCIGAIVKGQEKKRDLKYIETDRIADFLKEAYKYDYIYWMFFNVLLETGMRKGEAAALQWSDIDLKAGTISITKTLDFQAKSKEELFGDPKTYNSKRVITISKGLINDLTFHKKYQNQNKLALITTT